MSPEQPPDWSSLFDHVFARAAPADADAVARVLAPISSKEVAAFVAEHRNPRRPTDPDFATYEPSDPSTWSLPRPPIPRPYVDFLAWSDGATWQTGKREFSCFGCKEIRDYMLRYSFPENMPGALPIGLDGGGVFGVFDLRNGPSDAVWAIDSALMWEYAVKVADHFVDFCRGRTAVGDVYSDEDDGRSRPVDVLLVASPAALRDLLAIRKLFAPSLPTSTFHGQAKQPSAVIARMSFAQYVAKKAQVPPTAAGCVGYKEVSAPRAT